METRSNNRLLYHYSAEYRPSLKSKSVSTWRHSWRCTWWHAWKVTDLCFFCEWWSKFHTSTHRASKQMPPDKNLIWSTPRSIGAPFGRLGLCMFAWFVHKKTDYTHSECNQMSSSWRNNSAQQWRADWISFAFSLKHPVFNSTLKNDWLLFASLNGLWRRLE